MLALALSGCDPLGSTGPDRSANAAFQTSAREYQLVAAYRDGIPGWTVDIGYSFDNPVAETVYLSEGCVSLEKRVGRTWETVFGYPRLSIGGYCRANSVPPGERHTGTQRIAGAASSELDFRPRFSTDDLDGVYRLVWGVYVPVSGGHPDQLIPIEFRVSNRFVLRMPD